MPLYEHSEDGPRALSSLLLVEVNRAWSREEATLAPCSIDLPFGTVLARNDEGNFVPYLQEAVNNQALAVSLEDKKANIAAAPIIVIRRGAVLSASELFFLESVTDEQKTAAKTQLNDLGIVCQE